MRLLLLLFLVWALGVTTPAASHNLHEIQVVDEQTGRGIPLVELETVHRLKFVTDSAGRVAFNEPGLMNQPVFFTIGAHGYEIKKDGFGMTGQRVQTTPGNKSVIRLKRKNIAERLYRITGEGLYRDSLLLGHDIPVEDGPHRASIVGQDSAQAVVYRGKIFWVWGDTAHQNYPLGNFRSAGAISKLPRAGGLDPAVGVKLDYFTNTNGLSKQMCPFPPKDGVVWLDALMTVADVEGRERLAAHFARLKGLGEPLEHGMVLYNDEREEFERAVTFEMDERARAPIGHSLKLPEDDGFVYFCNPFPVVRARATVEAITNANAFEAWTCLPEGAESADKATTVMRDGDGKLEYRWTSNAVPVGPKEERALLAASLIKTNELRFNPIGAEGDKRLTIHAGVVRWNPFRRRWIMIATEQGGTSFLGEIWYAESEQVTGPWVSARKIVTHERQTFYNPVHHSFFDQEGGRIVYFEGTYTHTFSGNTNATPRYDYNQVMYRLDLSDSRLR